MSYTKGYLKKNKAINSERLYYAMDPSIQFVDARVEQGQRLEKQRFSQNHQRLAQHSKQELISQDFVTN